MVVPLFVLQTTFVLSTFVVLSTFGAPGASAAQGDEGPGYRVFVEDRIVIDTITTEQMNGARAHINFPYLKQQADGDLIANYSVGQTQSGLQFGRQSVSTDGGQTWTLRVGQVSGDGVQASLIRPVGQFSRGFGVSAQNTAGFTAFSNSRYNSNDGGNTWDNGFEDAFYSTGDLAYTFLYGNYGDVIESNGRLFMGLYGTRLGTTRNESVLFVSDDDGKHWNRRSTIASYSNSLELGQMGSEGPSETALLGLNNGELLAVYRTGQPFPNPSSAALTPSLFWSTSHDNGFTWSTPKSLGVAGVFPLLRKLDDGAVALTYGRHGAKLMIADPTGRRWTQPTILYDGPGSGHFEMRRRSDGAYVVVYDESGFYPPSWNAAPPVGYVYDDDRSANIMAATFNIRPAPLEAPVAWRIEYHGDVFPESATPSWNATLQGGVSTRLLAELGQDYLRSSTGARGAQVVGSYALDGADGSDWSRVDFSRGLVVEFRARAGSASTAEGAASLFLSDGIHGSITWELDGDSVNLEGIGGSTGQAEYTSVGHPGFNSRTWHDYRLTIHPDPSANGVLLAKLFLDGNCANAILTQRLAASAMDEIRFGDTTGANNGILELDYLRLAPLAAWGDFDVNLGVDNADQELWHGEFGQVGVNFFADADGSGVVDGFDFLTWQRGTGDPTGSTDAQAIVVPEPLGGPAWMAVLLAKRRSAISSHADGRQGERKT